MADPIGWVVVTFNQASHQPGLNTGADLHQQIEVAVNERDWERERTAENGRGETHFVAAVCEMDESEIGSEVERERARWARLAQRDRERRAVAPVEEGEQ